MLSPREALDSIKRYWSDAPVDVFSAARDLGLGPIRDSTLPDHISGAIKRAGDAWQIVVNANHAPVRQRFTVAHEIGHFIYHRAKLEAADGTSDTLAFRVDGHYYPNQHIGPQEEWQANTFASNFLIPDHVLKAAISLGITDEDDLAKRFNVSRAAMRIKLGHAGSFGYRRYDAAEAPQAVDTQGFDQVN